MFFEYFAVCNIVFFHNGPQSYLILVFLTDSAIMDVWMKGK